MPSMGGIVYIPAYNWRVTNDQQQGGVRLPRFGPNRFCLSCPVHIPSILAENDSFHGTGNKPPQDIKQS